MSSNVSIKPLENVDRSSPKWNPAWLQKRPETVAEVQIGSNKSVGVTGTETVSVSEKLTPESEEERLRENIDRKFVLTGAGFSSELTKDKTASNIAQKQSADRIGMAVDVVASLKTETTSSDVEDDPIEFEVAVENDGDSVEEFKIEESEEKEESVGTVSIGSGSPSASRRTSPTFNEDELDLDDDEDEVDGDLGEVEDDDDDLDHVEEHSDEVARTTRSSVKASTQDPVYSISDSQHKILSVEALASTKPAEPRKEVVFKQTKSEVIVVYDKDYKSKTDQPKVAVNEQGPGKKVIRLEVRQNEPSAKRTKLQP